MQVLGSEGHSGSFKAARVTVQCVCLAHAPSMTFRRGGGSGPDFDGSQTTNYTTTGKNLLQRVLGLIPRLKNVRISIYAEILDMQT